MNKIYTLKEHKDSKFKPLSVGDEVTLKENKRKYYIVDIIINATNHAMLTLDDGISMLDVSQYDVVREKI